MSDPSAEILLAFAKDPVLCARQLFPHWFSRPMPWFHRGLIAIMLRRADFLLNFGEEVWAEGTTRWTKKKLAKLIRCFRFELDPTNPYSPTAPIFQVAYAEDGRTPIRIDMVLGQNVVEIIPRGYAKTTVVNFVNTYKILFKLTKFTVYISEASQHAKDQLATIRRELSGNDRLIAIFGNLKPDRTDDETWGADSFETKTGVKLAAKGRGAQIRGMNKFGDRPDTIVLDDVEDKESVSTDVQRLKTRSWHTSDVEQALRRSGSAHIYAIGTILHPEALLPTLAKDPTYTCVRLGVIDPEGEPLWEDGAGMSMAQIEAKRQSFYSRGQAYEFGLEFLSTVRNELKARFKREYLDQIIAYKREDFIARAIHIDPAIGKKSNADFTAIAVVGVRENGQKHVCDIHLQQGMSMTEQIEEFFRLKILWKCTHHSAESTAYQAALAQMIREHMFRKAKIHGADAYFEITEHWPHGRKEERVEGILQPLMASGYLTFQRVWPELWAQFLDWPDGKKDGPDAIASAIATLEPYAAAAFGDSDMLSRPEEDYDPAYEAPCPAGSGLLP